MNLMSLMSLRLTGKVSTEDQGHWIPRVMVKTSVLFGIWDTPNPDLIGFGPGLGPFWSHSPPSVLCNTFSLLLFPIIFPPSPRLLLLSHVLQVCPLACCARALVVRSTVMTWSWIVYHLFPKTPLTSMHATTGSPRSTSPTSPSWVCFLFEY